MDAASLGALQGLRRRRGIRVDVRIGGFMVTVVRVQKGSHTTNVVPSSFHDTMRSEPDLSTMSYVFVRNGARHFPGAGGVPPCSPCACSSNWLTTSIKSSSLLCPPTCAHKDQLMLRLPWQRSMALRTSPQKAPRSLFMFLHVHEYQIIMTMIWKRTNDTGMNWRHVYKGLTVLEYLVAHGSE
ncbi:hypothetical protein Taro_042196 [Colocasia esculenta]|uniref:ENTH domain-containing protein n=1 Tax=Colocasia esculenta TaxID=4460 RepID=A0A843WNC8_COLES|nr:hypothetical protein [Colocasia esculenta]